MAAIEAVPIPSAIKVTEEGQQKYCLTPIGLELTGLRKELGQPGLR